MNDVGQQMVTWSTRYLHKNLEQKLVQSSRQTRSSMPQKQIEQVFNQQI